MKNKLNAILLGSFLVTASSFANASHVNESAKQEEIQAPESKLIGERSVNGTRFGQSLFEGNFNQKAFMAVHSDYVLNIGDEVGVNIWGAFEWSQNLIVDKQGSVFIPHVGPVNLAGIKAENLNATLKSAISKVYTKNVDVYATLSVSTPVQVFVSGHVNKPGMYNGASGDSILSFIDSASGINDSRGSYLDISLKRSGKEIEHFNLYDFLLKGEIPFRQLRSGDVIHVGSKKSEVSITGNDGNVRVEVAKKVTLGSLMPLVPPQKLDSHVRIESVDADNYSVLYLPIKEAQNVFVGQGDSVTYISDLQVQSIGVRVEGEHDSQRERVLKPNTTLGELVDEISLNEFSSVSDIQLFRESEKIKQKELFNQSLDALEKSVMTARSGTIEGAKLRSEEASLILGWVDKARLMEPHGQVVLSGDTWRDVVLETGDVVRIPRKTNIISVSGEVLFPRAITKTEDGTVMQYIDSAGGLSQDANTSRVLVMKPSGHFQSVDIDSRSGKRFEPQVGDVIMVLPDVKSKDMQFTKDITQIIYQIAIATSVVLGI
ncbi:polysaccharide biosynthesis/export family protein [Vibrio sp. D431a]|uniref:polysaccharide biosynthesis/export family protein n=1 Tax=Vibrio sp. D431a TaxID=2837388 RepID=UPI00255351BF|nr:polysaccharide biosynthesis/export family protein [Vibrio sp. D431a]MDK9790727.1 polysaccharide export protein [Vibrio sp. D431a]